MNNPIITPVYLSNAILNTSRTKTLKQELDQILSTLDPETAKRLGTLISHLITDARHQSNEVEPVVIQFDQDEEVVDVDASRINLPSSTPQSIETNPMPSAQVEMPTISTSPVSNQVNSQPHTIVHTWTIIVQRTVAPPPVQPTVALPLK
ncbi:hypothetical protein BJ741DRAFT_666455 [Chytriomyces cf. hyalinus JEL632]|nr:hypothetical protein BJ741DRAFT_666455 [Chytriomyces cf. hyalinus JEL632]